MKRFSKYTIILFALFLFTGCENDADFGADISEIYGITANLENKGTVNGLYDKKMNSFTMDISWNELFEPDTDLITGIRLYKGSDRRQVVRSLAYTTSYPSSDAVSFGLGTENKLSETEENELLSGEYFLVICTENYPDGIVMGQLNATYKDPDKEDVISVKGLKLKGGGDIFRIAMTVSDKLPVIINPYYADNTKLKYEVVDNEYITIDDNGMVTGVKPGIAQVKVSTTDGSNISEVYKVLVTHPDYVSDIIFNTSADLMVVKGYQDLFQLEWSILPQSALNQEITFESSDPSVVTVDENGVVRAIGSGRTTIIARPKDGTNITGTCEFNSYGTYLEIDRSGWTVSCSSSQSGNGPERAIDGRLNTLWHNQWSPATSLPQWLLIDMGSATNVTKIEMDRRSDSNKNDVKTVNVYVGNDPDALELIGTISYNTADVTGRITMARKRMIRYIKYEMTASNRGTNVSIDEARAYLME
jgi:uncharacterized protein YjdB